MQNLSELPQKFIEEYGPDLELNPGRFKEYFSEGIQYLSPYSGPAITTQQAKDTVEETYKLAILRVYSTAPLNALVRNQLAAELVKHLSEAKQEQPKPDRKRRAPWMRALADAIRELSPKASYRDVASFLFQYQPDLELRDYFGRFRQDKNIVKAVTQDKYISKRFQTDVWKAKTGL